MEHNLTLNPNKIIFPEKERAEHVLTQMKQIIDIYKSTTIGDFKVLVGLPIIPGDNKLGWLDLNDVQIKESSEGYLINFPFSNSLQEGS